MKRKILRIVFIFIFFISITSLLSGEELWSSVGAGVGFLPGPFSAISFLNIDGTIGISIHKLFNTPLRSDLEITYAGYLPARDSADWLSGIHGLQAMLLPGYRFVLGESFILTSRVGFGIQLLFASSSASLADAEAGIYADRMGTQLLLQGGLALDFIISDDWAAGLEGGYRMLAETGGLHHGALIKLVLNRKLADNSNKTKPRQSSGLEPPASPTPAAAMTSDKLVPLKGLDDVLVFQTENQITIILLNSFPAYDTALTEKAGEHLAVAGEFLEGMQSSKIGVYGYVAEVQEDDEASDVELSLSRAVTVKDWLILNGYIDISKETIAEGRSGSNPIGDNSTPEGRALNRRVEIVVDLADEGGK